MDIAFNWTIPMPGYSDQEQIDGSKIVVNAIPIPDTQKWGFELVIWLVSGERLPVRLDHDNVYDSAEHALNAGMKLGRQMAAKEQAK